MANQPKALVRAKPYEISITEAYRYNADISDHTSMSFAEAGGEIKVEFLYDGELRDFRWKLRLFWEGLCNKWIVLRKLNNWWKRFFNWGPLAWINRQVERILLGRRPGEKYFGIAAIEDAKKYGGSCQTAQVGFLALRGYRKPNFAEDCPENTTLKLEIPIDSLEEVLAQSQKYELCHEYSLQKPEVPPVHLQDVRLTDETLSPSNQRVWLQQTNGHFEELHSKYDEILQLEFELEIDGGQPDVDAENKVGADLVKKWWYKVKKSEDDKQRQEKQGDGKQGKEDSNKKQKNGAGEEHKNGQREYDHPLQEQIRCLEGLREPDELALELEYLSWRGGYLLVHLDKSNQIDTLKEGLLKAAFTCDPFVPIFEPYHYPLDNKPLVVVPVPLMSHHRPSYRASHLNVASNLWPNIEAVDAVVDIEKDTERKRHAIEQLAKTLSALANTAGGLVFLRARQNVDDTVFGKTLGEAIGRCHPRLNIRLNDIERIGGQGWIVNLKRASSTVHSVNRDVYRWVDDKPEKLSSDEVYMLIKDRCVLDYSLIMPRPAISYAHIEWPCFDARESYRVRYDPQKQIIKWSDEVQSWQTRNYRFNIVLPFRINRPVELYNQRKIAGEIHIELNEKLQSGLNVDYFDALGEHRPRPQGGPPIMEKTTKVIVKFDITLDPIFRRRRFTTERKLEFEGVKPDGERLKDLMEMLASLGLEDIKMEPARKLPDDWLLPFTEDFVQQKMANGGYVVSGRKPGLLWVTLHIEGRPLKIIRERMEGDRIDEMVIQAGKAHITIKGQIRGESPEALLIVLNRLQQLLKERFNYVRHQVV